MFDFPLVPIDLGLPSKEDFGDGNFFTQRTSYHSTLTRDLASLSQGDHKIRSIRFSKSEIPTSIYPMYELSEEAVDEITKIIKVDLARKFVQNLMEMNKQ